MRISESRLRNYVRQILQEKIFGNQAFVYHGSDLDPEDFVKIIEQNQFEPGKKAGAMYGRGLYTVYEEEFNSNTFTGGYGSYVYKMKVNLNGFLILDPVPCMKVYGKRMSIKEQLAKFGQMDLYKKLVEDWKKERWHVFLRFKGGEWNSITPEEVFDEPNLFEYFDFTSELANKMWRTIIGSIPGMVFTGETDGRVCLIYDPSTVVVSGYLDSSEDETTFRPITPGVEQIHRSATSQPDPSRYVPRIPKITVDAIMQVINKKGNIDRKALNSVNLKSYFHADLDGNLYGDPMNELMWKIAVKDFLRAATIEEVFGPTYLKEAEIDEMADQAFDIASKMVKK